MKKKSLVVLGLVLAIVISTTITILPCRDYVALLLPAGVYTLMIGEPLEVRNILCWCIGLLLATTTCICVNLRRSICKELLSIFGWH